MFIQWFFFSLPGMCFVNISSNWLFCYFFFISGIFLFGSLTFSKHPFFLFRTAPTAYRCSQARCWIRAVAAGLCHSHSNARNKPHLWPTPQQCQILNPLYKARDRTCVLMDPTQIRFRWTMTWTPQNIFFLLSIILSHNYNQT